MTPRVGWLGSTKEKRLQVLLPVDMPLPLELSQLSCAKMFCSFMCDHTSCREALGRIDEISAAELSRAV